MILSVGGKMTLRHLKQFRFMVLHIELFIICFMHKNILNPQNESNHTIVSLYVNEKGFKIIIVIVSEKFF